MGDHFVNFEKSFKIEDNVIKSVIDVRSLYGKSLGDEFIKALKKCADNVVIIDGETNESWTGQQMLTESMHVASALIGQGITKGQVVGFYIDCKHLALNIIGFIATIIAGLVYTGCDYRYPYEELLKFCIRSNVSTLLTSESTFDICRRVRAELPEIKNIFLLDKTINKDIDGQSVFHLPTSSLDNIQIPVSVNPEKDVAVIVFSSGSTGLPKAVCYSHRNVLALSVIGWEPFNVTSRHDDIVMLSVPMYHAADITMFTTTLLNGNRNILYPFNRPWLGYAEQYRATTVLAVNPEINYFTNQTHSYSLESVTDVILAGSKADLKKCQQFMETYKISRIRNFYGATETASITLTPSNLSKNLDLTCSGIVVPGVQLKIIDPETQKRCGPNQVGEIFAKTPSTCLRYLNNEQANREAFDADGFFKTGDAGFFDDSGYIYVTDRYKEIFKCDGLTVSPTEIEELLRTHEAVEEVAVFGKVHDIYGDAAKAFIVLKPNRSASELELIQFVGEKLVYYKHLLGGVEILPSFPKTIRGKIDRKILRNRI